MDYIFGTKGNQETLTTKNSEGKTLTGHRKVIRNFENIQLVTDEFDIAEQLTSSYGTSRYIIENHERIIDAAPFDFDALPHPIPEDKFYSWISRTSSASDLVVPIKDNTWLDNQGTVNLIKRISGNYYYADKYDETDRLCLFKPDTGILQDKFLSCITYSDGTHPTFEPNEYTFSNGKTVKDNLITASGRLLTYYTSNKRLSVLCPGTIAVRIYVKRGCESMTVSFPTGTGNLLFKSGPTATGTSLYIPLPSTTNQRDLTVHISKYVTTNMSGYNHSKEGTKKLAWYSNTSWGYFSEAYSGTVASTHSIDSPTTVSNQGLSYLELEIIVDPFNH